MSAAFEKLQQLSSEDRDKVFYLIDELYAKKEDQEIKELSASCTAHCSAFDVVREDADIYSLSDLKVKFA